MNAEDLEKRIREAVKLSDGTMPMVVQVDADEEETAKRMLSAMRGRKTVSIRHNPQRRAFLAGRRTT